MNVIAIIPARGGSKGVHRKNLKMLGNKPLIVHTIDVARRAKLLKRIIVSTEDFEIAEIASKHGAEVPFMRPKLLSADNIPILLVIQDAIKKLQETSKIDMVVVLQPTNPFRKSEDIDFAIERLLQSDADCIISVSEVSQHPYRMRKISAGEVIPLFDIDEKILYAQRQELPKVYMMDGSIIVSRVEKMMEQEVFYGSKILPLIIENRSGFDIDTPLDFKVAESMILEQNGN